jgi:protein gp37
MTNRAEFVGDMKDPEYEYVKDWRSLDDGECHYALSGEVYPHGYSPTMYLHRLDEPMKVKKPCGIFVCDTGDLFGEWVKTGWIEHVIDVIRYCPQHIFFLLTKNPSRYKEFSPFPDNCWCGTTVTTEDDVWRIDELRDIKCGKRFVSFEPLLGEIRNPNLENIDWTIIGAMTGRRKAGNVPAVGWISHLRWWSTQNLIPVFEKDNLMEAVANGHILLSDFPLIE